MNTPIISLHKVSHYDMKKSYSIDVYAKKTYIVFGKNGSGKTTLLKVAAGLIRPHSGQVKVTTKDISFQLSLKYLPSNLTVKHFLKLAFDLFHAHIDPVLWLILHVDMYKTIHELSKGQKQKLSILYSFIGMPKVVILDEPLNYLDQTTQQKLMDYFQYYPYTLLIATHHHMDIKHAEYIYL